MVLTVDSLAPGIEYRGFVGFYHTSLANKDRLGKKDANFEEVIAYMMKELEKNAINLGGNSVIGVRFDCQNINGSMLSFTNYHCYGTAVFIP